MKDAIESVFTSVMIEMPKSDEALLTELEEKRMKFEENRLKEEREYEEKRRREESVSAADDADDNRPASVFTVATIYTNDTTNRRVLVDEQIYNNYRIVIYSTVLQCTAL